MALAPEEVGARIREARARKGWTHQDFAEHASEQLGRRVNLRTVQRWQKGVLPRLGTLMELADLFEVPRSYFVEDDPVNPGRPDNDLGLREGLAELAREVRLLRLALEPREAEPPQPTPTRVRRVRPS